MNTVKFKQTAKESVKNINPEIMAKAIKVRDEWDTGSQRSWIVSKLWSTIYLKGYDLCRIIDGIEVWEHWERDDYYIVIPVNPSYHDSMTTA